MLNLVFIRVRISGHDWPRFLVEDIVGFWVIEFFTQGAYEAGHVELLFAAHCETLYLLVRGAVRYPFASERCFHKWAKKSERRCLERRLVGKENQNGCVMLLSNGKASKCHS